MKNLATASITTILLLVGLYFIVPSHEVITNNGKVYLLNKRTGSLHFETNDHYMQPIKSKPIINLDDADNFTELLKSIKQRDNYTSYDTISVNNIGIYQATLESRWIEGNIYYSVIIDSLSKNLIENRTNGGSYKNLTIKVYDIYGFIMLEDDVALTSFTSIVGENNAVKAWEYRTHEPMPVSVYRSLFSWGIGWNF